METLCLEAERRRALRRSLRHFRRRHHWLNGIYLVHDGGSSHIGKITKDYFARCHAWWAAPFLPQPTHPGSTRAFA